MLGLAARAALANRSSRLITAQIPQKSGIPGFSSHFHYLRNGNRLNFFSYFSPKFSNSVRSFSSSPVDAEIGKVPLATSWPERTHFCSELTASDVGKDVVLHGWMHRARMLGPLLFMVIRDGRGSTQVVFEQTTPEQKAILDRAASISPEYVISIRGKVRARPASMVNPEMSTGQIEIQATELLVLNSSATPPVTQFGKQANDEVRLTHRYLDLRSPYLQHNLRTRSRIANICRQFMLERNFVEVETPTLFRATPEGAREFLVPTRQLGKFYALPQSPQQYKQLLMAGAVDRYFQLARCYRDEDLRADRQPEFTQLDLEMAFITPEHIYELIEGLLSKIWKDIKGIQVPTPFPRMRFADAMNRFGSDKPDTRFAMELVDVGDVLRRHAPSFGPIEKLTSDPNATFFAINAKGLADLSSSEMTTLEEEAQKMGARFLLYHRGTEVGDQIRSKSSFRKMNPDALTHLLKAADISKNDLLLVCASSRRWVANWALGKARLMCAELMQKKNLLKIPSDRFNFLWVVDFPLYDVDFDNNNQLVTNHHPFTAPLPEDIPLLDTKPELVRGLHYDIVLNGVEVGGGSIRIHNHALQLKVLRDNLKLSPELISRFTHLLDALRYGCPPHGGLALGFDRLVALACGAPTLKDVIAFPKSASGNELMTKSPGPLSANELAVYGLKLLSNEKKK